MSVDRVTSRAAGVSTALHVALVVCAVWGGAWRGVVLAPPEATPPPPPPASPPAASELVLAPESGGGAPADAPLPALGAGDAPPLPIARPGRTDAPGERDSIGKGGPDLSPEDLPTPVEPDDALTRELRAKRSNPTLSAAEDLRRTTANFVDARLRAVYRAKWRRYEDRLTSHRLVLELHADDRGQVVRAALLRGTGVEELDQAIVSLLENGRFGLPPIPPGRPFWTQVDLR